MVIREIELAEVCNKLPPIKEYNPGNDMSQTSDHVFICACGFEDRSIAIPSALRQSGKYETQYSLVLEHETNPEDNASNLQYLTQCLNGISGHEAWRLTYKEENFVVAFDQFLDANLQFGGELPRVAFDISACSTQMIISTLKLLFRRKIYLKILFAEAEIYHPTKKEYKESRQDWTVDGVGMSRGILRARESRLHPSFNSGELPILLVAFPTFKPERINAIIADLSPAKTIWVLGIPHAPENHWRTEAMRDINNVPENDRAERITTFGYIETLSLLEQLYSEYGESYHMIIAPQGSKFQSVGTALFRLLRQDVGLWFSTPKSFNPAQYTNGVKDFSQIDFGDVQQLISVVKSCGKLELCL